MKKYKMILSGLFAAAFLALIASGCYYDSEEVLYPVFANKCDTTNVTYSGSIAPIVSNYCASCHGASYKSTGGSVRLDNYADLKKNIDDVIGAINHGDMNSPMPKNSAKLSACKIRTFEIWNAAGAPNN